MERLAPAGDVYQAGRSRGTRSRRRPASRCCAACASQRLRGARGARRGSRRACARSAGSSGSARWRRSSSPTGRSRTFDDAQASDTERYGALFRHLLERGHLHRAVAVRVPVRLARALDEDIDRTVEAVGDFFASEPSLGDDRRRGAAGEPALGRALPAERPERGRSSRRSARRVRARPRDDLRGLSRALRTAAALRCRSSRGRGCCSATTSTRTASCGSPAPVTSTPSPRSPS